MMSLRTGHAALLPVLDGDRDGLCLDSYQILVRQCQRWLISAQSTSRLLFVALALMARLAQSLG